MILRFLQSLKESGRAELVPDKGDLSKQIMAAGRGGERPELEALLKAWYHEASLRVPGKAPEFHAEAACWGAMMLFRAACFLSFREIDEAQVLAGMDAGGMPDAELGSAHFSADLALRFLPDIYRMAMSMAPDDPLVKALARIGDQVPLSSVGMEGVVPILELEDPNLRQWMAERALGAGDRAGLDRSGLCELARGKLGGHAERFGKGLLSKESS